MPFLAFFFLIWAICGGELRDERPRWRRALDTALAWAVILVVVALFLVGTWLTGRWLWDLASSHLVVRAR